MPDETLNILLILSDKLTAQMKEATKSVREFGKEMRITGAQVQRAGQNMAFLGAAVTGPLIVAFKQAAASSIEVNDTLKKLDSVTKSFTSSIANSMLPAMQKLATIISNIQKEWEKLSPTLRDNIVQTVLIGGLLLILSGTILVLTGRVIKLLGLLITPPGLIILTTAAIAGLMVHLFGLDNILRFIETTVTMAAIGFLKFARALQITALALLGQWVEMTNILQGGGILNQWIDDLTAHLATIQGGGGVLESAVAKIKELKDALVALGSPDTQSAIASAFSQFSQNFNTTLMTAYTQMTNLGANLANLFVGTFKQITSGFGQAIGQLVVYGGNFKDKMKEVFQQIVVSLIAATIDMMAQWLIMSIFGKVIMAATTAASVAMAATVAAAWAPAAYMVNAATFGAGAAAGGAALAGGMAANQGMTLAYSVAGGGVMHKGGVVKAHDGLAVDEVPILAQRGEGILSRRGMAALGGAGELNRLNSGKSGGGGVTVYIQSASFRSEEDIQSVFERLSFLISAKQRAA